MSFTHTDIVNTNIQITTIHRPEKRNALNLDMYVQLNQALKQAEQNSAIHVALIRGQSDCFTAGNDLDDFIDNPPTDISSPIFEFIHTLATFKKPLMAAIGGPAVGIGATLLLHCDYVLAHEHAYLLFPFISLALTPECGSSLLLPSAVGHARASELLMHAPRLSAQQAYDWGLVNCIANDENFESLILDKANEFSNKDLDALITSKDLLKQPLRSQLLDVIHDESMRFMEQLKSRATQKALESFKSKSSRK